MVDREPLSKGCICWLYQVSFERQQSTLGMYYQNVPVILY
jgi:hypothetical protein